MSCKSYEKAIDDYVDAKTHDLTGFNVDAKLKDACEKGGEDYN